MIQINLIEMWGLHLGRAATLMNFISVQPNPIYVEQFLLSIQIQRVDAAYDDYVYCMLFDDKCVCFLCVSACLLA